MVVSLASHWHRECRTAKAPNSYAVHLFQQPPVWQKPSVSGAMSGSMVCNIVPHGCAMISLYMKDQLFGVNVKSLWLMAAFI